MPDQRFLQLLNEIAALHERKNAGYAGLDNPDHWANFRYSELIGIPAELGCFVRLSDKYIRASNLIKNSKNDQAGESLRDTLIDLAAYALIAICLIEERSEKPDPGSQGNIKPDA